MQKVIKGIDCKNCIVTTDAMNAQKETARAIVKEGHGDYCLALKGNQKNAYCEVVEYLLIRTLFTPSMCKLKTIF